MSSIYQSIEILSKEKGIDPQIVLDAVKDAMLAAVRKQFKGDEDLVADIDAKGGLQVFAVKQVVEEVTDPDREMTVSQARMIEPSAEVGAEVRIPKSTDALGRISAMTAKQVILQKVREAERENIFSEFSGRAGELVTCTVRRVDGQDLIVDMGKTEARLLKREQSRTENFSVGDRLKCVIKTVEKVGKNAGVIVSRAAPEFVARLFEQEVPEIYDNTVVIKACAREAGERTKIAVSSRDRDVDSVGACVGIKGMRVQSIIRELRGEKIDIIEYSDDPVQFATNALSPAKISRVAVLNEEGRHMEVIVDDSQLSLAIGKKGQNVRLASKLLNWRIDIKSEEEKRKEAASAMDQVISGVPLSVLMDYGLSEQIVESLIESGVGTIEYLGSMTPEQLEVLPGIDTYAVQVLGSAVHSYYNQLDQMEAGAGEAQADGIERGADDVIEDEGEAFLSEASMTPIDEMQRAVAAELTAIPEDTPGARATSLDTGEIGIEQLPAIDPVPNLAVFDIDPEIAEEFKEATAENPATSHESAARVEDEEPQQDESQDSAR